MAALTNRMPLARNPMRLAEGLAASVLERPMTKPELLMTSVPPLDSVTVSHIHGLFSGRVPLRTTAMGAWPSSAAHLQCLHCGGACNHGAPVPAARKYDLATDAYWILGPFCRPCCALGYICETDPTSKQLAPTIELLRRFFGHSKLHVAPPRAAHTRFGGPLQDADFYGHTGFTTLTVVQPPFVTFANYVLGVHQSLGHTSTTTGATTSSTATASGAATALLPQSAGKLAGLERPPMRSTALAERRPTGKAPLILEFLAKLSTLADVKDADESIQVKAPPKKRARAAAEAPSEQPNFLKQYVKKA